MGGRNILEDSTTYQGLIRRGEIQGRQATILLQGRIRFGEPTPEHETKLKAVADVARLSRLGVHLLDATGWDDLLATE